MITGANQDQFGVVFDNEYASADARQMDAAWNAFHSGYISQTQIPARDVWRNEKISIADEYRFIRKNYHSLWSLYVLVLRITTLHNPITEWLAWWRTRKVKRINQSIQPYAYDAYPEFISTLIQENPLVSIIIPTLNRYPYLKDVLKDLENQSYRNFEVIVVDQSEPFQPEFYNGWNFPLRYWHQPEKALWLARNTAITTAKGEYLLLFDDDSRVDPEWIVQHLKCLDFFRCQLSAGVSISKVGGSVPQHYRYFRWADQLDTGNVMISKNVFRAIGLFDRQFERQRMGDGEFGLRSYLAGFKSVSNPYAQRLHLKVEIGGLRQMGSWDAFRNKKWLAPRPVPSVLYLIRNYFGRKAALFYLISMAPSMMVPYRLKGSKVLKAVSSLFAIPFLPILLIPMMVSWSKSSSMLKKGPIIEPLY